MRRKALIAIAVAGAGAAWLLSQSATTATLQNPPADADALFLVKLGGSDTAETKWDGTVEVINGELAKLSGYEMRIDDIVHPPNRFVVSTRKAFPFPKRPHDADLYIDMPDTYLSPRLHVWVKGGPAAEVQLRTAQGNFRFGMRDHYRSFENGKVIVERMADPALVGRDGRTRGRMTDNDWPSIAVSRDGSRWVAYQGFRPDEDVVYAEQLSGGRKTLHTVTERPGDVYRTAVAEDGEGKVWVVWSERRDDNWDLYGRAYDGNAWTSVRRLTTEAQPDIHHNLIAGPDGRLHLVWQGWRDNRAGIFHKSYSAAGGWTDAARVSDPAGPNCWEPSVAVDGLGYVHVVWDQYGPNGYDVWLRTLASKVWHRPVAVANSPLFEAYPSVTADKENRVWIAWHESGANWGKDWGFFYDIKAPATGLYQSRNIRMAVWDGRTFQEPAAPLEKSLPVDKINYYEYPHLAADGTGAIHAFFRKRTPQQFNVYPRTPSHQALWEIYSSVWDGAKWGPMRLTPYSTGRHHMRIATAVDPAGVLHGAWATDRRGFRDMINTLPDIFAGRFAYSAVAAAGQKLVAYQKTNMPPAAPVHADETGDVKRIREYAYKLGSETLRVHRGDMHRHTDISWDGYSDGATEDTYRYAIDAASFDFLAITEHNFGVEDEYDWWRSQKFCDIFRVGSSFVPLYAYERSATYPNGHRNIVFPYRGAPVLDVQHYEWTDNSQNKREGAERLFGYLRKYGGLAMPHTSATDMGTDWRDYDPEVEPVVEIYQSDRTNYECADCWRAADPANKAKQPGGYRPAGFVSEAWKKGYRLGVQASSDHMGVHTAYSMILAPSNNRQALVDAIRKRRTYGATDNIILDFRLLANGREYLMGSEAKVAGAVRFRVRVEGTGGLRDVEIVKDNQRVYTATVSGKTAQFEWSDAGAAGPVSFYYLRVRQQDGQLGWASPIWVER
ncbi:MAG: hypothetical protein R2729_12900 [Bryobacteraceae bacterium]